MIKKMLGNLISLGTIHLGLLRDTLYVIVQGLCVSFVVLLCTYGSRRSIGKQAEDMMEHLITPEEITQSTVGGEKKKHQSIKGFM